jgi:hemerythrin
MHLTLPQWQDLFKVGHTKIDEQHETLFRYLDDLKDTDLEGAKGLLKTLFEYTEIHFKEEEELFDRVNFPLAEDHKEYHRNLIEKLRDVQNTKLITMADKDRLFSLVNHWIKDHILIHDQAFAPYIGD